MPVTVVENQKTERVSIPEYQITYDRLIDRLSKVFSPSELKEYLRLYEKAQKDPKSAKEEARALLQKHDTLPEAYNLLTYIYVQLKKTRKAEKLIEENYQKNPKNLFAKINYADQCLRRGKTNLISEIFENCENLKDLYPNRETFHYSEVLGFSSLLGFYYLKKGDRERAMDYCAHAKLIDPEDSTVKHLLQKLSKKSILSHFLDRFQKR